MSNETLKNNEVKESEINSLVGEKRDVLKPESISLHLSKVDIGNNQIHGEKEESGALNETQISDASHNPANDETLKTINLYTAGEEEDANSISHENNVNLKSQQPTESNTVTTSSSTVPVDTKPQATNQIRKSDKEYSSSTFANVDIESVEETQTIVNAVNEENPNQSSLKIHSELNNFVSGRFEFLLQEWELTMLE